jgi:hypothetical protein
VEHPGGQFKVRCGPAHARVAGADGRNRVPDLDLPGRRRRALRRAPPGRSMSLIVQPSSGAS